MQAQSWWRTDTARKGQGAFEYCHVLLCPQNFVQHHPDVKMQYSRKERTSAEQLNVFTCVFSEVQDMCLYRADQVCAYNMFLCCAVCNIALQPITICCIMLHPCRVQVSTDRRPKCRAYLSVAKEAAPSLEISSLQMIDGGI